MIVDHKAAGFAQATENAPKPHTSFEDPRRTTGGFNPLPSGISVVGFELSVSYAETDDGQVFGPEAKKYYRELSAARTTRRLERARLRTILHEKGSSALEDEIKKQ
jgi:hypothetical protein